MWGCLVRIQPEAILSLANAVLNYLSQRSPRSRAGGSARSGNGSWVFVTELFLTADALQGRLEVKHPEVWAGLETEYCLFRLNGRGWRGKRRLLCMTVCPCDGCPYDCVRYRVCSFMLVSLRGMIVNVRSCVILCASVGYPVTLCPCDGCVDCFCVTVYIPDRIYSCLCACIGSFVIILM